jgi:hypothetical protein
MSAPTPQPDDTTALGTLGWVGVVFLGAIVALLILSWLGPVGGQ